MLLRHDTCLMLIYFRFRYVISYCRHVRRHYFAAALRLMLLYAAHVYRLFSLLLTMPLIAAATLTMPGAA